MSKEENLDNLTDELLKEENPTAEAVKSLIRVNSPKKGENSDIELKTDLSHDEVKIHSVLSTLNKVMDKPQVSFKEKCILGDLIEIKERKLLSKERKSRTEIVQVARQPDINQMGDVNMNENLAKRFFTSRRKNNM